MYPRKILTNARISFFTDIFDLKDKNNRLLTYDISKIRRRKVSANTQNVR